MKYTKIPEGTFKSLQLNSGVLLSKFTPESASAANEDILGATSGGVTFEAVPSFKDFGEDIDNCPKNMKELKKLESWEVKMTGSFVSVDTKLGQRLVGLADTSGDKVSPRNDVLDKDFSDIWWVGDYSDQNGPTNGGFVAVHLINALSTGGLKIQSSDRGKGMFAFEFTGHYSMSKQSEPPFELYVKAGTAEG